MLFIISVISLSIIWYFLKFIGRFSNQIQKYVDRLSVYTRFMHHWVLSAPATFTYVAIFCALTFVQKTTNYRLISIITNQNSTSIAGLSKKPLAMLFNSALWVADHGAGLIIYVAIFASLVAWSERKYGTPRLILIGASGHVFGSLLTVWVEITAINAGLAPKALTVTTDVGVSYIMAAGAVAALPLMHRWWLLFGCSTAISLIIVPIFLNKTVWDLGHFFASLIGLTVALILSRFEPIRKTMTVKEILAVYRNPLTESKQLK